MRAELFAVSLLLAGAAHAETYTFQQGVDGYGGNVDTQVRATDPDFVHGAEFEIGVDASDGGLPTQALMRFDDLFGAGAGQIGSGQQVVGATLTLNITSAGSGIRFHDMLQAWDAAAITWNSAGSGIQADGVEAATSPFLTIGANDGSTSIEAGVLVLDMTSAVQRMQSGAVPGFGWALLPWTPDGTNGVDFYSADWVSAGARPLLTVQTLPVPEPATLLLALTGGALVAARARRRR